MLYSEQYNSAGFMFIQHTASYNINNSVSYFYVISHGVISKEVKLLYTSQKTKNEYLLHANVFFQRKVLNAEFGTFTAL